MEYTRRGVSLGTVVYLLIGLGVAISNAYSVDGLSSLISFVLVLFLWPLVLLGIDLHIGG